MAKTWILLWCAEWNWCMISTDIIDPGTLTSTDQQSILQISIQCASNLVMLKLGCLNPIESWEQKDTDI